MGKEPRQRIIWPLPPLEPKIEFVDVYPSAAGLFKKKQGFWDHIAGGGRREVFARPFDVVADGHGKIYISDVGSHSVKVLDLNEKTLKTFVRVKRPLGMTLGRDGRLYVVDGFSKRVMVIAPSGDVLAFIGGREELKNPSFVALNEELGRLYVSDTLGHRIAVFSMDGESLFTFGEPGNGPGQFAAPQGLAIDEGGRLWVADFLNARIQIFDAQGRFLDTFGEQCIQYWCFENPKDLDISKDGTVFITDHRKSLLLAYSPEQKLLFPTGSESRTAHPLDFSTPAGIFIDKNGK
ncbi:MAG: 6-bladed beta-propeller, partial [Nitrospinaceae bacterium]|nr:6-bladed beta-propeller [Nitrospinaceae bacterium]